jgi:hypothetical protein
MNRNEVVAVLTRCASFDRRTVGQADVQAWLLVLGDLTYAECDKAVVEYYKENREWIMPSDIRSRVFAARQEWLNKNPEVGPARPDIIAPWMAPPQKELES